MSREETDICIDNQSLPDTPDIRHILGHHGIAGTDKLKGYDKQAAALKDPQLSHCHTLEVNSQSLNLC